MNCRHVKVVKLRKTVVERFLNLKMTVYSDIYVMWIGYI